MAGGGTKNFRSPDGCCICRAKSSSSRFTDSGRYQDDFVAVFEVEDREGDICNACVLMVKRWRASPRDQKRSMHHIVDCRMGPGMKGAMRRNNAGSPAKKARGADCPKHEANNGERPQRSVSSSYASPSKTSRRPSAANTSAHGSPTVVRSTMTRRSHTARKRAAAAAVADESDDDDDPPATNGNNRRSQRNGNGGAASSSTKGRNAGGGSARHKSAPGNYSCSTTCTCHRPTSYSAASGEGGMTRREWSKTYHLAPQRWRQSPATRLSAETKRRESLSPESRVLPATFSEDYWTRVEPDPGQADNGQPDIEVLAGRFGERVQIVRSRPSPPRTPPARGDVVRNSLLSSSSLSNRNGSSSSDFDMASGEFAGANGGQYPPVFEDEPETNGGSVAKADPSPAVPPIDDIPRVNGGNDAPRTPFDNLLQAAAGHMSTIDNNAATNGVGFGGQPQLPVLPTGQQSQELPPLQSLSKSQVHSSDHIRNGVGPSQMANGDGDSRNHTSVIVSNIVNGKMSQQRGEPMKSRSSAQPDYHEQVLGLNGSSSGLNGSSSGLNGSSRGLNGSSSGLNGSANGGNRMDVDDSPLPLAIDTEDEEIDFYCNESLADGGDDATSRSHPMVNGRRQYNGSGHHSSSASADASVPSTASSAAKILKMRHANGQRLSTSSTNSTTNESTSSRVMDLDSGPEGGLASSAATSRLRSMGGGSGGSSSSRASSSGIDEMVMGEGFFDKVQPSAGGGNGVNSEDELPHKQLSQGSKRARRLISPEKEKSYF